VDGGWWIERFNASILFFTAFPVPSLLYLPSYLLLLTSYLLPLPLYPLPSTLYPLSTNKLSQTSQQLLLFKGFREVGARAEVHGDFAVLVAAARSQH
jgi:hypothetical protein